MCSLRSLFVALVFILNSIDVASGKVTPTSFLSTHHVAPVSVVGNFREELRVVIPLQDRRFVLRTQPASGIFVEGFKAIHHRKDGTKAAFSIDKDAFHQGVVAEGHNGQPSQVFLHVGVNNSIHALFTIGDMEDNVLNSSTHVEQFHVEALEHYHDAYTGAVVTNSSGSTIGRDHLVYRYEDIHSTYFESLPTFCGAADHQRDSASIDRKNHMDYLRHRRSALFDSTSIHHDRVERSTDDCRSQNSGTGGKCDCPLTLVADASFMNADFLEGQGDASIAAQYMVNMAIQADAIYRKTYFSGTKGYGIAIGSVSIDEGSTLNGNIGSAESMLAAFSNSRDWSDTCLGHLFTNRDFSGTLGLAYIGTLCMTAVNTGFHSSYGMPYVVQLLTLTHEVGHNFGSEHDLTSACAPGDANGGNYIMYPSASNGIYANNLLFSTCSRNQISSVLSSSGDCLSQETPHCGNGIVEGDEVCDCGIACSATSCCTSICTVNTDAGYTCSPQNPLKFPCCTSEDGSANQCQFVAKNASKECDDEDNCDFASYCDGKSAACPTGEFKPDLITECGCVDDDCAANPHTGDRVCMGGLCNTSRCALTGATRCVRDDASCQLACKGDGWGNGKNCISTFWSKKRHVNQTWGVNLASGHTCNNNSGYCTSSGTCQVVGDDLAKRWATQGKAFMISWWWVLCIGIVGAYLVHLVVRRIHRVRRQRAYQPLDEDASNGRWLGAPLLLAESTSTRDGFESVGQFEGETSSEESDSDDAADAEDAIAARHKAVDRRYDFYERERRSVVFKEHQALFDACTTEDELKAAGVRLKAVIENGSIDQHHVMRLRHVYVVRMNKIRGFEPDVATKVQTTFDSACSVIDTARKATAQTWDKTKKKAKRTVKKAQDFDKQPYLYY
eukprot:m.17478 g.17478  ORF g.17478 m.17478 type:complete len:898 (+) comp11236_c0_seq2:234-2927(+)